MRHGARRPRSVHSPSHGKLLNRSVDPRSKSEEGTRIGNDGEMKRHEGGGGMSDHTWQGRDMTWDGKRVWENLINCTLHVSGGADSSAGGLVIYVNPASLHPANCKGKHLWSSTLASNSIPKARLIPSLPVYFAGIQPLSHQLPLVSSLPSQWSLLVVDLGLLLLYHSILPTSGRCPHRSGQSYHL